MSGLSGPFGDPGDENEIRAEVVTPPAVWVEIEIEECVRCGAGVIGTPGNRSCLNCEWGDHGDEES